MCLALPNTANTDNRGCFLLLLQEPELAINTAHKARSMLSLFWNLTIKGPRQAAREDAPQSGLGQLPAHMPSVANLMLFNSSQNPYKEVRASATLLVVAQYATVAHAVVWVVVWVALSWGCSTRR